MSTVVGPDTAPDTNAQALKKLRDGAVKAQSEMRSVRQWDRMKRMYMGHFWYDDRGNKIEFPSWKAKSGNPALWEIAQRMVPVLTARKPKFIPTPRGDEDDTMARMLGFGVDFEWERQSMRRKIATESKMALIFGNGLLYTGVHPGLRSDDLYTRVLTPYEVYPDPSATSMEDMTYCWFRFSVTKRQLAAILGPYGKKIFPQIAQRGSLSKSDDSKFRIRGGSWGDQPLVGTIQASPTGTASDTEIIGPQSAHFYGDERHYTLWECWLPEADDSDVAQVVDGEEIVLPVKGKGRRVLLIEDQYFEEMDTENPFKHGQIPLSVMSVDEFPTEFWAQSYLLPGADRAEQIADLDNQFSNHIRLTMNPGWKIPAQSNIPAGTTYSYPGMQLLYVHPYEPTQFDAPEIPSGAFQHRATLKRELDDAYGVNAISRGNLDGGITHTSGTTVNALQAPSSERMSVVLSSLEDSIGRWGYQTLCNLAQFWTEDKWRRVLPAEFAQTPLPWDVVDPQTGQQADVDYDGFMPDIKMETGSSLPEDKATKLSTAFNLNDRGAFGQAGAALAAKEMLTAAEWPGKEQIVQHVAMEQQAKEQAGPQTDTGPVQRADALAALITACAASAKAGQPPPVADLDAALSALGFPPWDMPHTVAAMTSPSPNGGPDFGGGQNKAFGGKPSPASAVSVQQTGQEVANA
jgi:hypothetical protein